jgi:tRNA G18 (ribose-2'-O)-methylase SpoU
LSELGDAKPCFVFGNENRGVDHEILKDPRGRIVSLDQLGVIRSFNVATASGIVLYHVSSNMGWLENVD